MRKIKPFSMKYKDYEIRITRIRQFKEKEYILERNVYKFTILLKKDDLTHQIPIKELEAKDKEDLEIQIRLLLNKLDY